MQLEMDNKFWNNINKFKSLINELNKNKRPLEEEKEKEDDYKRVEFCKKNIVYSEWL